LQEEGKSAGKIDVFQRKIELVGELDEIQKTRLLEIADKCPVHKTLITETKITTQLI
jgi:putative redox protein